MFNFLILIFVGFIAAVFTFFMNVRLKQGPSRSSALLSLLVGSYFHFFPAAMDAYLVKNIPLIFIGASFVGMVSARLLSSYFLIGLAGMIFCLIFLNASKFFEGFGGALGTSAAISLLVVLSIPVLSKKGKLTNGLLLLRKVLFKIIRK